MSSDQYPDALPVTTTGGWTRPGLPRAKRTYRWLSPALPDANVHGFSLEFGARETAEIDLVGKWDRERIPYAGLIDIKTHYPETPEDIIERVRTCLEYRDPERLEISTDCGLRRVPRYLAISKMPPPSTPPAVCAQAADPLFIPNDPGFHIPLT